MSMTWKERAAWLNQINRIHKIQEEKKSSEFAEQIQMFNKEE